MRSRHLFGLFLAAAALLLLQASACRQRGAATKGYGTIELEIRDATDGELTAARLELLADSGHTVIPQDALAVFSDCGQFPAHAWVPGLSIVQAVASSHREILNPYTGTKQFYTDGSLRIRLPAGRYSVSATKGPEYERASTSILVEEGAVTRRVVELQRWIHLASEGWFSADDHLHIPRPHPRFDALLAKWMEAEGLNVANLLQMGLARDVHLTPQHAFGPRAVFQRGHTLLLSGQENPRTHVLGHAIVLGPQRFIDRPREYLLYDRVWEEAQQQGAVNGYAHWGLGGAEEGLAVWAHTALLDFVEVLNLGYAFYDRWYEALDLGIRLGPTAGTDYPCLPGLPGRERFYARVDGPFEAAAWLDAVRRGRTFVTNGPAIELSVGSAQPGEELVLAQPGEVRVQGRVRFDPERDVIEALELVSGGSVVARAGAPTSPGEIHLDTTLEIEQTSWLALRAAGTKRGETEIDLRTLFSSM